MIELATAKEQVDRFITDTYDARALSERCRDYFDHKQWTEAEIEALKRRKQAPIVVNRLRPKIKGLVGLYDLRKTDPKAYPRTKKHDKSAHAATDALRFVADNNQFDEIRTAVAEDFFVEGYGGATVDVKKNARGEWEIKILQIPWDRIYFDPHSRKKDFSDARYIGYYLWLYPEQVTEMFPDAKPDELLSEDEAAETFEDRPDWIDRDRKRIRLAFHYAIHKGKWTFGVFASNQWLFEPKESPFHDEDGEPVCPIELVAANIDRNNNRYGEAAGFLDQQDELNHRRSKYLHAGTQRQTHGRKGAVPDVPKMKKELAKPDGHVEWEGEEFGKDFGLLDTSQLSNAQVQLYQDAKAELDSVSFNAQLAGERQSGDLSGKAIDKLQAAGTIELNGDYSQLRGWENRIYRQAWGRIKEFWTEEKWIRVTDDQDSLQWVGLNTLTTTREYLEDLINDESQSIPNRRKFSAVYMQAVQAEAQQEDPAIAEQASAFLDQIIPIKRNDVAEIDVDIIIDQSFDVINVQQEQFQLLIQFAQGSDIDIIELIEMSQIRNKEALIEKIETRRQQAQQAAGNAQQIAAEREKAELMDVAAGAEGKLAKAQQTKIENHLLLTNPERVTSVAV